MVLKPVGRFVFRRKALSCGRVVLCRFLLSVHVLQDILSKFSVALSSRAPLSLPPSPPLLSLCFSVPRTLLFAPSLRALRLCHPSHFALSVRAPFQGLREKKVVRSFLKSCLTSSTILAPTKWRSPRPLAPPHF